MDISEDFKISIGKRLKELRKKFGLSQSSLAEKLENEHHFSISIDTISDYETGKSLPKTDALIHLADIYNTSLDYIIFGKETSDDNSFTWYDNFKRLNRLYYTTDIIFHNDTQTGKRYLEFLDPEVILFWNRLESFQKERELKIQLDENYKAIELRKLDELIADFADKKEQLSPIETKRMQKWVKAIQTDWVAQLTVDESGKQYTFTIKE